MVCSNPDNNSNGNTRDDFSNENNAYDSNDKNEQFEIQEETALLIESIMHPEFDNDPELLKELNNESNIGWDRQIHYGFDE